MSEEIVESDAEKIKQPPSVSGSDYDFYRCKSCGRLITRLEELEALKQHNEGQVCQCGGRQYRPTNPVGEPPGELEPGAGKGLPDPAQAFDVAMAGVTEEWALPRVREFAWRRFMGEA